MDQKMARAKKVVIFKNQFFHVCQPREGTFEIHSHQCCIFTIFGQSSNGRRHTYFENWCLKISTGTPEDMLLTNFGVNRWG